MKLNFFDDKCKEAPRNEERFGICDDQIGQKAYTDHAMDIRWAAKVKNAKGINVTFTAIDNCLQFYKKGGKDLESTCDGMLTFENGLYLVELKDRDAKGWIPQAKKQLENTIRLISENHDLSQFRYKKAFACNKKHPHFAIIEASEKKTFFERSNGFRLDITGEIAI